jgi:hypothetical protein
MRSYNPIRRKSQPSAGRLWKFDYVAVSATQTMRNSGMTISRPLHTKPRNAHPRTTSTGWFMVKIYKQCLTALSPGG